MADAASLTDLIRSARGGDSAALQLVFQQTYDELRRMARNQIGRAHV